jgi:hypothetical protein
VFSSRLPLPSAAEPAEPGSPNEAEAQVCVATNELALVAAKMMLALGHDHEYALCCARRPFVRSRRRHPSAGAGPGRKTPCRDVWTRSPRPRRRGRGGLCLSTPLRSIPVSTEAWIAWGITTGTALVALAIAILTWRRPKSAPPLPTIPPDLTLGRPHSAGGLRTWFGGGGPNDPLSDGAGRPEPHADGPGHHGARALRSARARDLLHRLRPRPLHPNSGWCTRFPSSDRRCGSPLPSSPGMDTSA